MRPALELVDRYDSSLYFIADYHGLTSVHDRKKMHDTCYDVAAAWSSAAEEWDIPLILDSAAGFGASGAAGRRADAEVFSMHATKPLAVELPEEKVEIVPGDYTTATRLRS